MPDRKLWSMMPFSMRLAFGIGVAAVGTMPLAAAQTTPPQPAAAQPSLPQPMPNLGSKTLEKIGGPDAGVAPLKAPQPTKLSTISKAPRKARRRHVRYDYPPASVPRPALAGVELAAPLPRPGQPPHFTTPTPAYPFENAIVGLTMPLPPTVCHRVPRDPFVPEPDPRLYRQVSVACQADNP